jgi:hypothetical protein
MLTKEQRDFGYFLHGIDNSYFLFYGNDVIYLWHEKPSRYNINLVIEAHRKQRPERGLSISQGDIDSILDEWMQGEVV